MITKSFASGGGVYGYLIPEDVTAVIGEGQYMIVPEDLEIEGILDLEGIMLELEDLVN